MANIIKFNGYMVNPTDNKCDAKDFMDLLEEFAIEHEMYTGPLVTEARKFKWEDDLLINDINCPDEVFEMYFDGTIKTTDDLEEDNSEEEPIEESGCDTCSVKEQCTSPNKNVTDKKDEDVCNIYITYYDGVDDEEESEEGEDEWEELSFTCDTKALEESLKQIHKNLNLSSLLEFLLDE